jgi:hypothetical protein
MVVTRSDSKAGFITHSVLCYVNLQLKPFKLNEFIQSVTGVATHRTSSYSRTRCDKADTYTDMNSVLLHA